jgi:hemerythrin superfamily protein
MAEALDLTERLEAELPAMLAEHKAIVGALTQLQQAAVRAKRDDIVQFAQALIQHARTEEEVMYPAALLVGRYLRARLPLTEQT